MSGDYQPRRYTELIVNYYLHVKDESEEFNFAKIQHLESSCFLFILQEGEVLEKVGMRTYKNTSLRKPEGTH